MELSELTSENRPQPKYALLTFGEYFKLNHLISVAKGWELGNPTERSYDMTPISAKINIQYDNEGNEISYETVNVLPISAELQINYPDLISGIELYDSYIPSDSNSDTIEGEIEPEVIDWTLNHYQKFGIENENLRTYIAGQDIAIYPTIPNVGEWCESKVYSYNGNKVKCLQPHHRMQYLPEETPALWLVIPSVSNGYPEWVQPTGGHDAYQKGDKVEFNSNNYESLIDANVWSPTVYSAGWKQI